MSDLPDPMTPPDCDLRGNKYMPLLGHKLFGSTLYAQSSDAEFRASIKLWWSAWNQCPAGSLPNSDAALAMLADYGRDLKGWAKVKDMALRGFVLCSDGRLYHSVLCEAALEAYASRLKADKKRKEDAERLRLWRETKKAEQTGGDDNSGPTGSETDDETHNETRFTERSETRNETQSETQNVDRGREEKRREEKKEEEREGRSLRSLVRSEPVPRSKAARADAEFAAFYAAYPRKQQPDDGLKAWRQVIARGVEPAEIMAGLARHEFADEARFIPLPASWLRAGCWKDEPLRAQPEMTMLDRVRRDLGLDAPVTIDHEEPPYALTH